MIAGIAPFQAKALSDGRDWLISADEPLAGLQRRCGGAIPGMIAIPALLDVVRKARRYALRLARPVSTHDGTDVISAWVEVLPGGGTTGCEIIVRNWQVTPIAPEDPTFLQQRIAEIDRELAELTVLLDAGQRILTVDAEAGDLLQLAAAMRDGIGRPWTDFAAVESLGDRQPVHWRLLDGATITVPGSARQWKAHLFPQAMPGEVPTGFELCLTSDEPPPETALTVEDKADAPTGSNLVGGEIAPVLRDPVARIIANAEIVRTRLAGPLADDYANYAADIAGAGKHLLGLLDDLADLAAVEAPDFAPAGDTIDLAETARQAAGILGALASKRGIAIEVPGANQALSVTAEPRRVLQILLNLLGNAIRYSLENTRIAVTLSSDDERARVTVADQGPGLDPVQQSRVFEKFERLGRSGDGGSGLGLYISRRLARAMGGELSVESAPGQGARFTLEVPRSRAQDSELSGEPDHGEAERR